MSRVKRHPRALAGWPGNSRHPQSRRRQPAGFAGQSLKAMTKATATTTTTTAKAPPKP